MHSADNVHVLPLCQIQCSNNTRRKPNGSSATVDRGSEVLFYFEMTCHSAVIFAVFFFISPFLSCTKVTTKRPKAKRLLGECGGTMPSITPRSEDPRTRFARFSCVVRPCPMEHMVQTLDGRSLVLTSIFAESRAAFRVQGIPPLSARICVMCCSASSYFRQGIRFDPRFVFFV